MFEKFQRGFWEFVYPDLTREEIEWNIYMIAHCQASIFARDVLALGFFGSY